MARFGFAPGVETAAVALGLGPVGWIDLGVGTAVQFIRWFTPDRGNYAKFDREVFPTLASASKRTGLDTVTGWFNELVGTDPQGNRKVYGSWPGLGPEWGNLAAAKIMELGQQNFLWSFQPNSDKPWVIVGPHPSLLSVVYISFETLQAAIDWWASEEARIIREGPQVLEGPEPEIPPVEPDYTPIDPGEVSAPPDSDPNTGQTKIDPPTTGSPRVGKPGKPWWWPILPGITSILFPRRGGGMPPYGNGQYPPGGTGGGLFGGGSNDYLYLGAAGLLLLAARKKKKRKHAPA